MLLYFIKKNIIRNAASLSPYIREFMGKQYHCIVNLTWIDGENII